MVYKNWSDEIKYDALININAFGQGFSVACTSEQC